MILNQPSAALLSLCLLVQATLCLGIPFKHGVKARADSESSNLPDLYEAGVDDLRAGLDAGSFASVDLVKAYLARIAEVNRQGPGLRAVLETNPSALDQAATLDKERQEQGVRGPLHGIPVLVKDNIATVASEGMNTTAGSLALIGSIVPDDAGTVKKLRAAGAIILGKTNPSEWSNFRGNLPSGWSGRGGQTTSAYFAGGDPCGSSAGSGVAASIGLATLTLGTETAGSIICPANQNNVVGIKPTVGLTSRAGVIPISENQDSVGPMTRSVSDAAILLSVIAGKDPNDNFTLSQPDTLPNYTQALDAKALSGKRIGIPRKIFLDADLTFPAVSQLFEDAIKTVQTLGATVVDPADIPTIEDIAGNSNEDLVLSADFKIGVNAWFSSLNETPTGVTSLADLIPFNDANPSREQNLNLTDQLITANQTVGRNATYEDALASNKELGGAKGIDAALQENNLDALLLPSTGFATSPAALAGYPMITVPMGFFPNDTAQQQVGPLTFYPAPGMPIGVSFIGTAFSEFNLIGFAYAYEQATKARLNRTAVDATVPKTQLVDVIGM